MDILKRDIRETIVSGLFYPEDPDALTRKTEELLNQYQSSDMSQDPQVILCPHGSWDECGKSIASAFSSVRDFKPDRILLMGPVHREKNTQELYLSSKKYFDSPLGLIPVEQKICQRLSGGSDLFTVNDSPHMEEHALELSLPYLRTLFPETPIVPVLAGQLKRANIKKAAAILRKEVLDPPGKTLLILSANMSRFGVLNETENESAALMRHLDMPLEISLLGMEKTEEISSCGTVLFTLLSDLGIFKPEKKGSLRLLEKEHSEVFDKKGTMAVYYAGGLWV